MLPEVAIFRSDVTEILDDFASEDEPLLTARGNAEKMGGAVPVSAVTGAALRFLAAAVGARAVVEIGTGYGTSGIWLLRGMRPGSVLTSVDLEPEHHSMAKAAFAAAGFPSSRYRLITGRALEVLPRLADGAYDLVFCDPPYADSEILATALAHPRLRTALSHEALVVARAHRKHVPALPEGAHLAREKELGEETLMFVRYGLARTRPGPGGPG